MLLYYAVVTLHVIVCVILVLVVLLQAGRGADLAGAFGGGATQTAFGSRGPASFLSKMTTVAAVIFMLTNIGLAVISTKTERKSVLETTKQTTQPAKKAPAEQQPVLPPPTPEQIQKRVEELQLKQQKQKQASPAPNQVQDKQKPSETKQPAK